MTIDDAPLVGVEQLPGSDLTAELRLVLGRRAAGGGTSARAATCLAAIGCSHAGEMLLKLTSGWHGLAEAIDFLDEHLRG